MACAVGVLVSPYARGAEILQTYYAPFPENDMQTTLNAIDVFRGYIGNEMRTVLSMTAGLDDTVIYYDHWEDGYELDVTAPTQGTTQVWGDDDPSNGIAPGFTQDVIRAGTLINLEATIDVTRNVVVLEYDGRDRISATRPISLTRALYAINPGEVLAEACAVFDTGLHGMLYRAPVGVGTGVGGGTNVIFSYSSFYIMGSHDFTRVELDVDNDGLFEETRFLNAGEPWFVNGGVRAGATVKGSKPFQCHLVTGDIGSTYEMRWYELWPEDQWGSDYYTPAGSRLDPLGATTNTHPAITYFFNPNTNAITLTYETRESTGTFAVAAGQVSDHFMMPLDSGGRFYTTNADPFLGVLVFDTRHPPVPTVLYGYQQHCQTYDWGIGLIPRNTLSTMGICSWGPGYGTTGTGTNGNPIWVTPVSNTTVYVDLDSDPTTGALTDPLGNQHDFSTNVNYLQSVPLFNNVETNQTRMRFYTVDGTPLAAAWGADPQPSEPGNPYLDMGYNILPFPTVMARKYAVLFTDNNTNGYPDPADELEFVVDVVNVGFATARNVIFRDDLPTNLTIYVNNSSYVNGSPVPDDLPPRPTRFPFDGAGYDIGTIPVGQTSVVRYVTAITETLPTNFLGYIHNNATVFGTNANWSAAGFTNILLGGLVLYKTANTTNVVGPGDGLAYTLTLVNTGQFTYTGVTLEDYLPLGVTYVSNSTGIHAPGGLTNRIWDRFNTPSFTNSSGNLPWANAWREEGEGDGASLGKVRVTADTNSNPMELFALVVSASNAAVWRAADLTGHTAAFLEFKYRRENLLDVNQYVDVFISTNGWAASNFLGRFQGAATDTNYVTTNVEISAWIGTNTAIRFHSSSAPSMTVSNRVWFDDVKLIGTGSNLIFAGNPPPVLFENMSLPPGTSIVAQFTVQVDNPPLSTQLVNTARARAEQHENWLYAETPATNRVAATSGVTLAKSVAPAGLVAPGSNLLYTLIVANTGNVTQTGIVMEDLLPVGATYVSNSARLVRGYLHTNVVLDLFNQKDYTNQDGNVDWRANWTETGDDASPTSGTIQVTVDNTVFPGRSYVLRMAGASGSITRSADLRAGYTSAVLSLEYRRADLTDAAQTLSVQVSSNGGAAWATLETFTGPGTDGYYLSTNWAISAYISSNTAVRFLTSASVGVSNLFYFDTVQIAYSGAPATNWLRDPPELLDGRYTLPGGQTMTLYLNALVDNPPASTQLINTARYRSDQQGVGIEAWATNTQNGSIGATITKTTDLAAAWGLYVTNTYSITVVNTGAVTLTGVRVTDLLPTNLNYIAASTRIIGPIYFTNMVIQSITTGAVSYSVRDEFNAQAYTNDNSTGGAQWGGSWQELTDTDGPTAGNVRVVSSWNNYVFRAYRTGRGATREIGLGGITNFTVTNVVLSFDFRGVQLDGGEFINTDLRTDPGSAWNRVWGRTNVNDAATLSTSIIITAYSSTGMAIRLYVGNAGNNEGGLWDNVNIAFQGLRYATNLGVLGWRTVTNQGGGTPNLATNYTLLPGSNLTVQFKATLNAPLAATQFVNQATMTSTQSAPISAWVTNVAVPVAVGDWVWFDANTNGIQDGGELGISNVTVWLYTATTNWLASTNTSATGYYLFSGWPAGSYFVEFVKPSGYWFAPSYQGGDPALDSDADPVTGRSGITNLVGGTNMTLDAGLYVPPSAIGDFVWFDTNTNGIQNVGEPPVTGVVVRLYNSSSNLLATTTNKASGFYAFTNLPTGSYCVEFVIPTQYVFTLSNQGADDTVDSDADPVTGRTAIFNLGTGTNDVTWDAGLIYPVRGLFIAKTSDLMGCTDPGKTATYTIVVYNTNVFAQTGVTVSDPAPAGTAWRTNSIYIQAPSAGYTGIPPTLAYGYVLAAGQAMTVTVKAVISAPAALTQLVNTAYVYGAGHPAVEASVTSCLTSADLGVIKTETDSEVAEVQVVQYTVTVTNRGPDAATGLEVTDLLPANLQYNSHSNGLYVPASGLWTIGSLPAFAATSLYINVTVREGMSGQTISNRACVSRSDQYDPISTNNCGVSILRVTLVVLARFEALNRGGRVALEWETVAEIGTVGFHLYRREPGYLEEQRVTEEMLPALVGVPQGGVYRYADPTAEPGRTYVYELEEIDATGQRLRYGPFTVTAPVGKAARNTPAVQVPAFTSVERTSSFREARRLKALRAPAFRSRAAASGWAPLKLTTSISGVHYLGADELAAATGAEEGEVRERIGARQLRLTRQGESWPWYPAEGDDGIFFLAPGYESPFTAHDAFGLEWADGVLMVALPAGAPGASERQTFEENLRVESNRTAITYYAQSVYDDYWIWQSLSAPATRSFTFDVLDPTIPVKPNRTGGSPEAELTAWLWGATTTGATNEHQVTLRMNGQVVATEIWSGVGRRTIRAPLNAAWLRNGSNTVSVSTVKSVGVPYSIVYVDKFDLRYPRRFRARDGRLTFPADGNSAATITGLTVPDLVGIGLADDGTVSWLTDLNPAPAAEGYAVSLRAPLGRCWLSEPGSVRRVDQIQPWAKSAWASETNRADHVIITPRSMTEAAEMLAAHRRAEGLLSIVVPLEELYDEFNGGREEPAAIKRFLAATRTWACSPAFALLAGQGTEDYRNYSGTAYNILPTMLLRQPDGLFCSDGWFGDVDDDGLRDIAIGRLPVISSEEVRLTVDKLIRAETAEGGAWRQTVILAADRPDQGGEFIRSSAGVSRWLPSDYQSKTVSVTALGYPDSRTTLRTHIRLGAAVVNYFGHGALDRIAADTKTGQSLLDVAGITALDNSNRLPVIVSLSCSLGRFSLPNYDCLGTALLLETNAGAAAVWAPSGQSFNQPARVLADGFYKALFRGGVARIGEGILEAARQYNEKGQMPGLLEVYNLLGDPAMPLGGAAFLGSAPTLAHWRAAVFSEMQLDEPAVSDDWADPDGDGLPNIAEYALGYNPHVADGGFEVLPGPQDHRGGLVIEYSRRRGVRDVAFAVQAAYGLDLQDWFDGSEYIAEEKVTGGPDDALETVRITIQPPADFAPPRLFIRLSLQP